MCVLGKIFVLSAFLLPLGVAQAEDKEEQIDKLRRKTPSGQYIDPASFFRFHGYNSLSFTRAGDQVGPAPGGTPQILINPGPSPQTGFNEGGFRNDAALFVGGEPLDGVGAVIEIHFVGDATDPVLTEAKMSWDLGEFVGNDNLALRLIGGRYWWPFGIHNDEWFSAVNRFSLLSPTATEVVPTHYNEVGAMLEGELVLSSTMGLNFALSVGNGVSGFHMPTVVRRTGADANGNRTFTGRLGLAVLGGLDAELGVSVASGQLRDGPHVDATIGLPPEFQYAADFTAFGPDLTIDINGFGLRSYFYSSTEELTGAPVAEIARTGMTVEPSYTIKRDAERFKAFSLIARYSMAEEENLAGQTLTRDQIGVALNVFITDAFIGRLGYVIQGESDDLQDLDNNAMSISMTSEF